MLKEKIFELGKLDDNNFGDPIKNVDWTLTKNYSTIFGDKDNYIEKIQQGIKNGDIKKFNKKRIYNTQGNVE